MKEPEKIPSPFKAPDGYFDSFEERLKERLSAGQVKELKVVHRRNFKYLWIAAASALLLAGAFWAMSGGQKQHGLPGVVIKGDRDTVAVVAEHKDSARMKQTEDDLMLSLAEEPSAEISQIQVDKPVIPEDSDIAAELDEAGLIVADLEDGIFEDFNIIP